MSCEAKVGPFQGEQLELPSTASEFQKEACKDSLGLTNEVTLMTAISIDQRSGD